MRRLGFLVLVLAISGLSAGFASACDNGSNGRQSWQDSGRGRGWNGDRRYGRAAYLSRSQRGRMYGALARLDWRQNGYGNRSWDGRSGDQRWQGRDSYGGSCNQRGSTGGRSGNGRWKNQGRDGYRSNDRRWDDQRSYDQRSYDQRPYDRGSDEQSYPNDKYEN